MVVTGSRSEAGLLAPLVGELRRRAQFEVIVVATGDHVAPDGSTEDVSSRLGFAVDTLIHSLVSQAGFVDVARSVAAGVEGCSSFLAESRPDLVLVLGDRFESYAAALACHLSNTPLAHIHGGEKTLGSQDDSLRHSMTKFARLHFVSHEVYRRRVIQLGELPSTVQVVGGLGIDAIRATKMMPDSELEDALGRSVELPFLILSVHPESNSSDPSRAARVACEALGDVDDVMLVVSLSNSDYGSDAVNRIVREFSNSRPNTVLIPNLGSRLYLSLLARSSALVGNSSSGILEAPAFGTPSLNIGSRQRGRVRPSSVSDVEYDVGKARGEIHLLLRNPRAHFSGLQDFTFGDGTASRKIADHIESMEFPMSPKSEFFDL